MPLLLIANKCSPIMKSFHIICAETTLMQPIRDFFRYEPWCRAFSKNWNIIRQKIDSVNSVRPLVQTPTALILEPKHHLQLYYQFKKLRRSRTFPLYPFGRRKPPALLSHFLLQPFQWILSTAEVEQHH